MATDLNSIVKPNIFTGDTDPSTFLTNPVSALNTAATTWKGAVTIIPDILREITYPTPFAVSPLLPLLLLSLARQKHTPKTKETFKTEYDYIIVGAGTAGSVVASRLSEEDCVSVLLLEAGRDPPMLTEVPSISGAFTGTDIDWKYKTEPQRHAACGINGKKIPWPKGKVIGGTSIINGMLYFRGNRQNYDDWKSNGATGWGWNEVFKYFLKSENNIDKDIAKNGYHNVSGLMTVGRFPTDSEFKDVPSELASAFGYRFLDPNGDSQIGFGDFQGNIRDGQRCSCAKAYLVPAENRTNLDIVANAFVTKIQMNGRKAEGVQFDFKGRQYTVKARKEVIMSAGSVNTPKLLMLSGIGPRQVLENHGIEVIKDLPVGKNFHDHVGSILNFEVRSDIPQYLVQLLNPVNQLKYINNRTGPLANGGGIFSLSFFTNDDTKNPKAVPDHQIYLIEAVQVAPIPRFNLRLSTYTALYAPYLLKTTLWCMSHCIHPRSRGYVSIRSSNPYDSPVIDPNYYSDPEGADLNDVVTGLKRCLAIARSEPMKRFLTTPFETRIPECVKYIWNETKYLMCYAKYYVFAPVHDVGTAKMGSLSDPSTVVDPELRVKGIENLRVVDASVMPTVPTGNTYNPVIMVAEKASDMIRSNIQC